MPTKIKLTNKHHWGDNLVIYLKTYKNCKKEIILYDTLNNQIEIFDEHNATHIKTLFKFTGTHPNNIIQQKGHPMTLEEIYNWIYSYPIQAVKIIRQSTCGCNMGHCGAILDYHVSNNEYNTLGQLFEVFGYVRDSDEMSLYNINPTSDVRFEFYEHPDSLVINIKIHNPMIKLEKIHKNLNCYDKKINSKVKLDPAYNYLMYGYSR